MSDTNAREPGISPATTSADGLVTLDNGLVSVTLDPTRGGEIRAFTPPDRPNAISFYEWDSPLSVTRGPSLGTSELDWLSKYRGGWQTLFPNAGAECVVDGVPVAFHGEASLAQTEVTQLDATSCTLRVPARLPLVLTRRLRLAEDSATLLVEEEVTNVGTGAVDFIWGHHPTFPAIPGARIDVPPARVHVEPSTPGNLAPGSGIWPLMPGATGGIEDLSLVPAETMVRLIYLEEVEEGWAALRPPQGSDSPGIALAWDREMFPHVWIWLQNGDNRYPWWGRAHMIGLEPQRSWPFDGLGAARDRGQSIRLAAGAQCSCWVTLTLLPNNDDPVTGVSRLGEVRTVQSLDISGSASPQIDAAARELTGGGS